MSKTPSEQRVVMAHLVARRWLETRTRPEYRLTVYYGPREIRGLPGLLRSWRDAKIKIGGMDPIPDLGVKEGFDSFEVWSSNREGLLKLKAWCEARGCETTGVW